MTPAGMLELMCKQLRKFGSGTSLILAIGKPNFDLVAATVPESGCYLHRSDSPSEGAGGSGLMN